MNIIEMSHYCTHYILSVTIVLVLFVTSYTLALEKIHSWITVIMNILYKG